MTAFSRAISICGLSKEAAAEYLGAQEEDIDRWCSGRRSPPMAVWVMLSRLFERIDCVAKSSVGQVELVLNDEQELNLFTADCSVDPLPLGAEVSAGAIAILFAVAKRANTSSV